MTDASNRFVDPAFEHGICVFNWRQDPAGDLGPFSIGYRRAGQALAEQAAEYPGFPDYDGYPIFFLYRHALELALKAVVYEGARTLPDLGQPAPNKLKLFSNHNLKSLLPAVRQVLDGLSWPEESGQEPSLSIKDLEAIVSDVDQIDHQSFTFRYPVNKDETAAHDEHLVLNVLTFAREVGRVLDVLDDVLCAIEDVQLDLQSYRSAMRGVEDSGS